MYIPTSLVVMMCMSILNYFPTCSLPCEVLLKCFGIGALSAALTLVKEVRDGHQQFYKRLKDKREKRQEWREYHQIQKEC